MKNLLLLICALIAFSSAASDSEAEYRIYYLTTSDPVVEPEHYLNHPGFVESQSEALNFANTDEDIWLKLTLEPAAEDCYLLIDNATIDSLSFFFYKQGERVSGYHTGDNYNYASRDIDHPQFIFELPRHPHNEAVVLIRLKSRDQLFLPLQIKEAKALASELSRFNLIKGLYYGIIIVMFLYNFVIAFITRDGNYFIYSLFILVMGLAQASLDGFTFKYFMSESPKLFNHGIIFFSVAGGVLGSLFTIRFLQVRTYAPKWLAGLYVFIAAYAMAGVFDWIGMKSVSNLILNVCGLTVGLYMLLLAGVIATRGYRPANFYLIAYVSLVAGLLIYVLRFIGIVPMNTFTNNALALGNVFQIILLSVALADRINLLRKEKEESQAEALRVSRENERIIREQNVLLEQKVDERTLELQEANEELTVTLANLRDTQTQLVDAEKMASLGQLTAGIAHEINNPINFVTSNIKPLKRDLEEMYELIDAYAAIEEPNIAEALARANELKEELDYEYLKEEIASLVDGITDGADRTSEIVKGLRTFSRLDEDVIKKADIHEGLNSTMILLRSKTKEVVEVDRQFNTQFPEIDCFPGKLNQVFMNMISNAIYAVKKKQYPEGESPNITLKTEGDKENIKIHIIDNGIGMSEHTQKKIFDPFFTTKEVGEGTGLGMSIVYKIIEKHRGHLEVRSELGRGTEFIINLPVRQPNEFE